MFQSMATYLQKKRDFSEKCLFNLTPLHSHLSIMSENSMRVFSLCSCTCAVERGGQWGAVGLHHSSDNSHIYTEVPENVLCIVP